MKKILSRILIFSGIVFTAASCSKEKLELFPFNSIELSQAFKTMDDARAWDNGLFGGLRGRLYGAQMFTQDVQGDQLNASLDYGNRNGNPHRWGTSFLADDGTISSVWQGYYSVMKNVNAAIDGYPLIATTTPAQQALIARYTGNAHLLRAYMYSELIVRYAKAYDAATASTDLGVPLVVRYNPSDRPSRATIQEVYTQILADITTAKTLLAAIPGAQGSTRFTIHSALALEARVKLNLKDWPGAKTAADQVIATNTYPLYTTAGGLNAMWKTDATQEVIQQAFVSAPLELANTNNIYLGLVPATGKFIPDFIPSQWVIDAYDNADLRKNVYFAQKTTTFQGVDVPNIWLVNKYEGNPALFTGATTNYQQAPKMFRVAELFLISAEAGSRMGGAAEADALNKLNTLRTARGLAALVGVSGTALYDEVKAERFRELAFEGFRLWDLKRWNEGFTRRQPQNMNIIQVGPNFFDLSIPANAEKFTWAIPARDMTSNEGLTGQQNPGW
jgi:hypothetical protein